jgi:hypothetical protein
MLFPYFKDKKINHIVSKEARKFRNKYAQTVLGIKKPSAETNGSCILAPITATSPDLEIQGFLAVVFIYREYSVERD